MVRFRGAVLQSGPAGRPSRRRPHAHAHAHAHGETGWAKERDRMGGESDRMGEGEQIGSAGCERMGEGER